MKSIRFVLLAASIAVVLLIAGSGLALRVGASDTAYRDAVVFSQVLSLVLDTYVDPVEAGELLDGAFAGMLRNLDPHGAYLTPREVAEWKKAPSERSDADPGFHVVKSRGSLHVVFVAEESPAERQGIRRGDQIRAIDGAPARDLSLAQARRRLRGEPGSTVRVDLLRLKTGFEREEVELKRTTRDSPACELRVVDGIGVLAVRGLHGLPDPTLAEELEALESRGIDRLLLDLRDLADGGPREAAALAGLFADGPFFEREDRTGRRIESVEEPRESAPGWAGPLGVLVNGATAGGSEGVAKLLQSRELARVYGEDTYGLGAEPELFELPDGAGVLLSASRWRVAGGDPWNEVGVEPDVEVRAPRNEDDEASAAERQLRLALERFAKDSEEDQGGERKAA